MVLAGLLVWTSGDLDLLGPKGLCPGNGSLSFTISTRLSCAPGGQRCRLVPAPPEGSPSPEQTGFGEQVGSCFWRADEGVIWNRVVLGDTKCSQQGASGGLWGCWSCVSSRPGEVCARTVAVRPRRTRLGSRSLRRLHRPWLPPRCRLTSYELDAPLCLACTSWSKLAAQAPASRSHSTPAVMTHGGDDVLEKWLVDFCVPPAPVAPFLYGTRRLSSDVGGSCAH